MTKQTHVAVSDDLITPIGSVDLNGDGIGYVESYDFSKANMSQESRIAAITAVASVCYQNPKALGSISLYDRLATENKGLPSSSYEFVPVLIELDKPSDILDTSIEEDPDYLPAVLKYSESIENGRYLVFKIDA